MKVLVINGPNINLLGTREPSVYGNTTLGDLHDMVQQEARRLGIEVIFFQSNHEGEIIERIHAAASERLTGMIVNPAAFTHTSVAIRDALLSVGIPFIEIHLSPIAARESFRQVNLFSDIACGTITGLGPLGYVLGLHALKGLYGNTSE